MVTPKLSSPPPRKSSPVAARGLPGVNGAELLAELGRLANLVSGFQLCDEASAPTALDAATAELGDLLLRTLELLRVLERLNETVDQELDLAFDDEQDPETRPRLVVNKPVVPKTADVCFAGTLELNRARIELERAEGVDEAFVAAETALRKLRRVTFAVLQAAQAEGTGNLGSVEHLRRRQSADLGVALEVRRLYAEFRQALRRPESEDPGAVLTALRYAAGALAVLTASPPYSGARASDRCLLRRLRDRLLGWSRAGRDVELGLQLLEDVWTCADLLRDVNRRQELRAHDAALIEALLATADPINPEWLERARMLAGLDDELDRAVARARDAPNPESTHDLRALLNDLRQR